MGERLAGKAAIITGAGSGIGRATALRFAAEGARVCVADRNLTAAAETVELIGGVGGKANAVEVDTRDEAANEAMVASCVSAFGAVDVLVAAAGIGAALWSSEQGAAPTLLDYPTDGLRHVLDVNLYGVLFSDRAAARWMVANGRPGAIINLASIASKLPRPGGAYSISKAGVWMLTKVLAADLARYNIRVNAVGPGYIDTPLTAGIQQDERRMQAILALTPMRRFGSAEEVANTILFLASDEASYFTGEILHPAGGMFLG